MTRTIIAPLSDDGPKARQVIAEAALEIERDMEKVQQWQDRLKIARYEDWKDREKART